MSESPASQSSVLAPAVDYKQSLYSHGNSQFVQVYSNQYGSAINLNAGQTPIVFNLPSEVMNFGQSHLMYQVFLPGVAANYIWYAADTVAEITHIQLYGASNQFIADFDNLNVYMKIAAKRETSFEDYLSNSAMNRLYPADSLNNVVPALRILSGSTAPQPSSRNYTEPAYFAVGGLGADVTLQCQIPLQMLKNCILSVDKNLYFNQVVYLKIFFGPIGRVAYQSTSNTNPGAGAPAAYLGAATINNLQLMLAVETDQEVRGKLINQVQTSGMSMIIPYVQSYVNTVQTGSSQQINIQLDAGSGKTLMKMYHSVFSNFSTLTPTLMYDCSNLPIVGSTTTNQKVMQYYTNLNNRRNQNITVDCTTGGFYTDYLNQKNLLKGSVIADRDQMQYNWCHIDDWSGFTPEYIQEGNNEQISGVPLGNVPITWTFVGTSMTSAAYTHYSYGIFTKRLTIGATGPTID